MSDGGLVVGIDWAHSVHAVHVLSEDGEFVDEREVPNTAEGLVELEAWLHKLKGGNDGRVRIGVESPTVLIAEFLSGGGFEVHSINPKQSDRFRDRYFPSGAKDDSRDAKVIARALLTDPESFRCVVTPDPTAFEFLQKVREYEDAVEGTIREAARLRELLERFVPDFLQLCSDLDRDWSIAVCDLLVKRGRKVTRPQLAKALARVRVTTVEDVLKALRSTDLGIAAEKEATLRARCAYPLERLKLARKQAAKLKGEIEQSLKEAEDSSSEATAGEIGRVAAIGRSFPGLGRS